MSDHRNLCKSDKTLVVVTGRVLEKVVGFDFKTWVLRD